MTFGTAAELVHAANKLRQQFDRSVLIAIDGPSCAGKSTLAFDIVRQLHPAYVVQTDVFHFPLAAAARLQSGVGEFGAMIDWRRLRETVIKPALVGQPATYPWIHPVSGLLQAEHSLQAGTLLLVEGTFSARPELWDYYDFRILVNAPADVRRECRRLRDAELGSDWSAYVESIWMPDEERYCDHVDASAFDLVIGRDSAT